MSIDIIKATSNSAINNKMAICSTLPTGQTAKHLIRPNTSLTIGDIESKFADRFDDVGYYGGSGSGSVDGGDVGGDVLGV